LEDLQLDVAVVHALKKFGIELLLTKMEAIAAGLGSHGCKVPKIIVRVVHAKKLHQNFLIFVPVIPIHALTRQTTTRTRQPRSLDTVFGVQQVLPNRLHARGKPKEDHGAMQIRVSVNRVVLDTGVMVDADYRPLIRM